jgi:DNA invertase Pin-like site-specific DNA recombinase
MPDRPELQKALAVCRKHKGKLVIAKLDRLSRNLAFIATLMDSNVRPIARALTARGVRTARSGEWTAVQVSDI